MLKSTQNIFSHTWKEMTWRSVAGKRPVALLHASHVLRSEVKVKLTHVLVKFQVC